MSSLTKKTRSRRRRKAAKTGKANKQARVKNATPKFPIQPEK